MSEADKMFKKLGYYKQNKPSDDDVLLFYVKDGEYIIFYKDKEISTMCNDRNYIISINMQELQAINKKAEELGWLK
jgi:predicted lactoylglutathione lyase